jgi:hypothetical protein
MKKWSCDMMKYMLRENNVIVSNGNSKKEHLIKMLNQFYIGESVRSQIAAPSFQSAVTKNKSKSTKPLAVTKEGTYYRAINSILHPSVRTYYIQTGNCLNKSQLDSRRGHKDNWLKVFEVYNDKTDDTVNKLGELSNATTYYASGITNEEPTNYDQLTLDDFINLIEYINFHYKKAKNNNETSGQHEDFPNYVSGKVWLIFYWAKLMEIGDTALSNIANATLVGNVMLTSQIALKRRDAITADSPKRRSQSINNGSMDSRKKKNKTQLETLEAMKVRSEKISMFLDDAAKRTKNDRLIHLINERFKLSSELDSVQKELLICTSENKKITIQKKKMIKCQFKIIEKEYQELKKVLNYNSDDSNDSDDSDSSI